MEGMASSPDLNRRAYSKALSPRAGYAVLHVIGTMSLSDSLWCFADLFAFQAYGCRYHYSTTSRGHVHGHHKVSQFRAYGFHHLPPKRHRGTRANDPVVYCRCISLRHKMTGSAFPFHTDGAIFRSLSPRPVILHGYHLHTVHHWAACDACYPDKQVISGIQLAWVSHISSLACHPAWCPS